MDKLNSVKEKDNKMKKYLCDKINENNIVQKVCLSFRNF